MTQLHLSEDLQRLSEEDWFREPLAWTVSQWYIIGVFVTDFSLCSGVFAKRWASELSVLNSEGQYLICGNKDEIVLLFEYLCLNKKLPLNRFHVFKVLGNKIYKKVDRVTLSECKFDGTRESEVHFHIFMELKDDFVEHLLRQGFLFDAHPDRVGVYEKHLPIEIITKIRQNSQLSLLAGLFDGDGSVGATIKCPNCSKVKTLRGKLVCPYCNSDVSLAVRTLDYYVVLDSRSSLLDEEIIFLSNSETQRAPLSSSNQEGISNQRP